MANEIISLANLQRFKTKCDSAYSKKLYWHTITISLPNSDSIVLTAQTTSSVAYTQSTLKALNNKHLGGFYYKNNDDAYFELFSIQVAILNRLYYKYIEDTVLNESSGTNSSNWSLTDTVEAI